MKRVVTPMFNPLAVLTKYIGIFFLLLLYGTCFITSDELLNGIVEAKSIWFIFITGLLLLYLAVVCFKTDLNLQLNALDIVVSVFLLYLIANNTIHDGQVLSRKNLEDAALIVVYFFSKTLFRGKLFQFRLYAILMFVLVFSQITIATFQWLEFLPSYNSNFRFTGIFFNPAPFTIFLSATIIYCLNACLFSTSKIVKVVGLCLFTMAVPIVVIAFSRSAWLGLSAGIVLVFLVRFRPQQYLKSKVVRIAGLILIGAIICFTIMHLYGLKKESADGRLLVWKLSLNMISDRPFSGIGQENFAPWVLKYQSAYFEQNPDKYFTEGRLSDTVYYAFNDLLQLAVEQGLIGLALFGTILIIWFNISRRLISGIKPNDTSGYNAVIVGAIASVLIIIISGLTSYPLVMLPILIVFFGSMGLLSGCSDGLFSNRYNIAKAGKGVLATANILMGVGFIVYSIALYRAYYLENSIAKHGYNSKEYHLIVNSESWYALRQCDYLLYVGKYMQAIVELEKAKKNTTTKSLYFSLADLYTYEKKYSKAEKQLLFMYYALPALVEPKYRLAMFYYNTGQNKKWKAVANQLLNFHPKIASHTADQMIAEIRELYNK